MWKINSKTLLSNQRRFIRLASFLLALAILSPTTVLGQNGSLSGDIVFADHDDSDGVSANPGVVDQNNADYSNFLNSNFLNSSIENSSADGCGIVNSSADYSTGVSSRPGDNSDGVGSSPTGTEVAGWLEDLGLTGRSGVGVGLRTVVIISVFSLAPGILLMTTSYVRIVVVLSLLRQALGTQLLPSNQVVSSLAMFMTGVIMWPVWQSVYHDAVVPYLDPETQMSAADAWSAGVQPVREFMSRQIEVAGNGEDVWLFYEHLPHDGTLPQEYAEVPIAALMPAFMLSELKTAFLLGFQIYLPFLILDLVISSVTVSMGMLALPPTMISLPFKLLMFVLVDGWHLVVGMLLQSFGST